MFIIDLVIYNLWQWFRQEIQGITLSRFTKIILIFLEQIITKEEPPPEKRDLFKTTFLFS